MNWICAGIPFKVTVTYNYDALHDDELTLVIGDVIEVISEVIHDLQFGFSWFNLYSH